MRKIFLLSLFFFARVCLVLVLKGEKEYKRKKIFITCNRNINSYKTKLKNKKFVETC